MLLKAGIILLISYLGWKRRTYISLFFSYLWLSLRSKLISLGLGTKDNFTICSNRRAAYITFSRLDQKSTIYLPYSSRLLARMSGHQAILFKGDQQIDITQQVGIPYLVTASDLGGSKIVIHHQGSEYPFLDHEKIDMDVFNS